MREHFQLKIYNSSPNQDKLINIKQLNMTNFKSKKHHH